MTHFLTFEKDTEFIKVQAFVSSLKREHISLDLMIKGRMV